MKKTILRTLVLLLAMSIGLSLAACGGGDNAMNTPPEKVEYFVEVLTEDGRPLENVGIHVYTDTTKTELVWFAKTDADGKVRFTEDRGEGYVAYLSNVPAGYKVEECYDVTETTYINLTTELAPDDPNVKYQLGDMMRNFTVTDLDGKSYTLSEILTQKKAVVLNFWYFNCDPCKSEFPYLEAAYALYGSEVEFLAVNPVDKDATQILAYRSTEGLTFPMALSDQNWESKMSLTGYPTTVIIDRTGMISLIHKGVLTDTKSLTDALAYYVADDYKSGTVAKLEDLAIPMGTEENPHEISGMSEFTVEAKPGENVYYNVYRVNGMNMEITSNTAYVIYEGKTYHPENGKISLLITTGDNYTPVKLVFGTDGSSPENVQVSFSYPEGTYGNPYTMNLGDFTANVAEGNEQGVYYTFVAEKNGTLTLQCTQATAGIAYDISLYNLTTSAFRTLGDDGVNGTVSIQVSTGDEVQVIVNTKPDSSNNYPAATLSCKATFKEGGNQEIKPPAKSVTYTLYVKNENGKGVPNVAFTMTVGDKTLTLVTNASGVVTTTQPADTYTAILTVPAGYTASSTEYQLTKDAPTVTVSVRTIPVMKDYVVTVVDDSGKAISGVTVTVGTQFAVTSANGTATFTLNQGSYTAVVTVPSGYTCTNPSVAFGSGTSVTVTLNKEEVQKPDTTVEYKVTVVDYNGNAVSGVLVNFFQGGTSKAAVTTGSNGVAAAKLEPGNYQVTLASSNGKTLYYDTASATLSATAKTLQIKVAYGVSTYEELYVGNAYHVTTGGNHVTLTEGDVNYFLFTPTKSGTYRFSTDKASAVLSYWGGNTFFIQEQTGNTDYANNSFSLSVKDSNIGASYILGVTGSGSCTLIITRTGEAQQNPVEDAPWTKWETDAAPNKVYDFSGNASSLTFVDVTAAAGTYSLVYNSADGYYHMGSANGPVVMVMLGENAPYISFKTMLDTTGVKAYFYNAQGSFTKKEDYTDRMSLYVQYMDADAGVYPLTKDLKYVLENYGNYAGWYDSANALFLFKDPNGEPLSNVNKDYAWMFACCYVPQN